MEKKGGIIRLTLDGAQLRAKGAFTYNLGEPKNETIVGADGVHGIKETVQVPYIEGAITDGTELDLAALCRVKNATVMLDLANGKSIVLREACFASEGEGSSEEGEIKVRFEGVDAKEIKP